MTKKKSVYLLIFAVVGILFLIYFRAAFRRGIWYYDDFLSRVNENEWSGTAFSDTLRLTREREGDKVLFHFAWGTETEDYTVFFDKNAASNESLKIYKGDALIFTGYYSQNLILFDSSGEWIVDDIIITPAAQRQPAKIWLVKLALNPASQFRGNLPMVAVVVFVFLVLLLDIRFPMLFFYLSHGLAVSNPEPSDFYYGVQKLSRVILGAAIGVLMIMTFL